MLENLKGYKVMLVSGSPRRQELLRRLDIPYTVGHSLAEETYPEGLDRHDIPMFLSLQKAEHCSPEMNADNLIIAADTIVWMDHKVYGKPASVEQAKEMLRELSGRQHYVVTGVTLKTQQETKNFFAETAVNFGPLSEEEIKYYVDTFHPLDKAGAYGIQEWIGMIGVECIQGSFYNVMGLPLFKLYNELKKIKPCC